MQGRARPSLAQLYNWRYTDLGDLPNVAQQPEYRAANPGLAFEYQLIDVPDGEESAPLPYFYQVRLVVATDAADRHTLQSSALTCCAECGRSATPCLHLLYTLASSVPAARQDHSP